MKLITKLLLALTMLASTGAAQAFFDNFIEPFDATLSICEDEVEWTGFFKVTAKDTGGRVNASINLVASGIGESGDIYSLTANEKFNVKESEHQFFLDEMVRVRVRNFDTGERYWVTINFRLVANDGADLVLLWESEDIDACLFG